MKNETRKATESNHIINLIMSFKLFQKKPTATRRYNFGWKKTFKAFCFFPLLVTHNMADDVCLPWGLFLKFIIE